MVCMFRYLCALPILVLFFTGCSPTLKVQALHPAEVTRAAKTKQIAVTPFDNDRIGLSDKVEAELSRQRIDGRPFFTLASRKDFRKVVDEQKYQNAGLINPEDAVEMGQIIGAEAIISGRSGTPSVQDIYFYEPRTRCNKEQCWTIQVSCTKRVAGLSAQLRMVDVAQGDVIYADTLEETAQWRHCSDDANPMPSKQMAADHLATLIAKRFAYKLTPHYVTFEVELLDDPDTDYTDGQEKLLEYALTYIEQKRYDKAEQLLRQLLDDTGQRSYVPFYNLGVLYERKGQFREALNYYEAADRLTLEPVDAISAAVVRVRRLIVQSETARAQMGTGE